MSDRLTCREIQIAKLVAKGLTNKQIGVELWITQNSVKQALKRIFRKLKVSSRTEMVAIKREENLHRFLPNKIARYPEFGFLKL